MDWVDILCGGIVGEVWLEGVLDGNGGGVVLGIVIFVCDVLVFCCGKGGGVFLSGLIGMVGVIDGIVGLFIGVGRGVVWFFLFVIGCLGVVGGGGGGGCFLDLLGLVLLLLKFFCLLRVVIFFVKVLKWGFLMFVMIDVDGGGVYDVWICGNMK